MDDRREDIVNESLFGLFLNSTPMEYRGGNVNASLAHSVASDSDSR